MMEVLPTFLVTGAGRCGTTGLVEGLRTHPDVFVTSPKEPHYFGLHGVGASFQAPGDEATINRVAVTEREPYLDLYADAGGFLCRGDGSVSTIYYPDRSIPAIDEMNPDMRLVVMLREPVDRAFSSFQYMRTRGFEPHERFLDAIAEGEQRKAANWHHLWHYVDMSLYADSVAAFLDHYGPEQVGIWFYDELQADYEGTVSQVLRFIGAPQSAGEASGVPRVNISGTPRSKTAHRVIWAATRNEWLRRTVKRMTSYRLREYVRRLALRPDGVTADERAALQPLFDADLARLGKLLADHPRPLPAWLATARAAN